MYPNNHACHCSEAKGPDVLETSTSSRESRTPAPSIARPATSYGQARNPDNARCEGFFGTLRSDFFGGRDWAGVTFEEFSRRLDAYIERYRSEKVKKALRWKAIRRHKGNSAILHGTTSKKRPGSPREPRDYSETCFAASFLAPHLPESPDVCFAGLQLGGEVAARSLGFVCLSRSPNPPSPQASARR